METFGQKINPQQRLKGTDLGEGKKKDLWGLYFKVPLVESLL